MMQGEIIAEHPGAPEARTGPATLESLPRDVLEKIARNIWDFRGIIHPKPPVGSIMYERTKDQMYLHSLDLRPFLISKHLNVAFTDTFYGLQTFRLENAEQADWFIAQIGPHNVKKIKRLVIRVSSDIDNMGVSDERRWELFAIHLVPQLSTLASLSLYFREWHAHRNTARRQGPHSDVRDEDNAFDARKRFVEKMSKVKADWCRVAGGTWLNADEKDILRQKITGEWDEEAAQKKRESVTPVPARGLSLRSRVRLGLQPIQVLSEEDTITTDTPTDDNSNIRSGTEAPTRDASATPASADPASQSQTKPMKAKRTSWIDRLKPSKVRGLPARGSKEFEEMVDEFEATGDVSGDFGEEVKASGETEMKESEGTKKDGTRGG